MIERARACVGPTMAGLLAAMALGGPRLLPAQATPRVRPTAPAVTVGSRCAELTASPSALAQAPEGRALLRFKRELDDAAIVLEQRGDSSRRVDIKRISLAQRGVDSLLQVFVRFARDGVLEGPAVMVRRGDSLRVTVNGHNFDPRQFFESVDGERRLLLPQFESEMRELAPRLQATIRSMQPQVAAFSEEARARIHGKVTTTGWLGMHLSESKISEVVPDGVITNYCDYPVIESVDAASPAEKAGLVAGDTVIAYNGRDLRTQGVNYAELLVPGQLVRMRVRRGARPREVPVTVGVRPPLERTVSLQRLPCVSSATCDRGSAFSVSPSRAPASPAPTVSYVPVPLPPPSPAIDAVLASSGITMLAGAQMSGVDDEFAQRLGIEPGVLVLRVLPGTASAEAGLKPGDVIHGVNGVAVRDLLLLRRAFTAAGAANGAREVKLAVSARNEAARIVTVRW